ncbi:MAG: hypothetical protein EOO36_19575, partial [Cytophagaceae bacterium]
MFPFWKSASARWAAPVAALGLLASCSSSQTAESNTSAAASDSTAMNRPAGDTTAMATAPQPVKPSGAKPAWGPGLHPEMQAVIEQLTAMSGPTPLNKLAPPEARKAPSATDATMATMKKFNIPTPPATADTMSRSVMPGVKVRI